MTLWDKRSDMIVRDVEPYNAESNPSVLVEQFLTDSDRFYSRNHGPIPDIDVEKWSVTIDGLVATPTTFTLQQLRDRFEHLTVTATLQCAGNRRADFVEVQEIPGEDPWGPAAISTAQWTGVRLSDILSAADMAPHATDVAFSASDVSQIAKPPQPYGSSIPAVMAQTPEVLLAWGMNGHPLPRLHGGPVRVVVPGFIGARSVKWIDRITAQDGPSDNYFQATAYRVLPAAADPATAGPGVGISLSVLPVNSAILDPEDGATVPAGERVVTGYAFSGGGRAIARVELSTDGGISWMQAHLDTQPNPWAWTLWRMRLDLPPGCVRIVARAWDVSATTQPESAAQIWNPKGYLNNAWPQVRLTVTAGDPLRGSRNLGGPSAVEHSSDRQGSEDPPRQRLSSRPGS